MFLEFKVIAFEINQYRKTLFLEYTVAVTCYVARPAASRLEWGVGGVGVIVGVNGGAHW
jgi:hypothetical protein